MKLRRSLIDLALSAVAGYVGTKATEPVTMRLYQWESEAARAREDAARPYRIAAEKLSRLAGLDLDDKRLDQLALVFHYGPALQWAPLYPLLRRRTQLAPLPAGLSRDAAPSACWPRDSDPLRQAERGGCVGGRRRARSFLPCRQATRPGMDFLGGLERRW